MKQWSIFANVSLMLHTATNHAAERLIRREIEEDDSELVKRLDWDTEAGAVGVYADAEQDISTVAEVLNRLLRSRQDS